MRKIVSFVYSLRFVLLVTLGFFVLDGALASMRTVEMSTLFRKNDYEKLLCEHDGNVEFDNVLYGNSVLISAFVEEHSATDYVNFGMDYATVDDLHEMLSRGQLIPRKNLVILLNYFVILDTLDTNPTYPWHREPYSPYVYFNRDRLLPLVYDYTAAAVEQRSFSPELPQYTDFARSVYNGMMTDQQLDERIAVHREKFWGLGMDAYSCNLDALGEVIRYCSDNGVRLRLVIAPWNDYIDMPDTPQAATNAAADICRRSGVEVYDMSDHFPRDCFHDLGHFNYEYGALRFTEEFDKWLDS